MKKLIRNSLLLLSIITFSSNITAAQCTWSNLINDGFEYTTPCPDVIPGTVYTTVPQSYEVHSGQKSLYLNFVNCTGGTGTCAGDTAYIRTIPVCQGTNYRVSAWFVTTFAGPKCNLKLVVMDANNLVLDVLDSLDCPNLSPWVQYQSPILSPNTATIKFVLITNVGGGNGNDLSMDDFIVEQCINPILGADTTVCNPTTLILDAGAGYVSYLWQNGSTNQTFTATNTFPGNALYYYNVTVVTATGCTYTDSIDVFFADCTGLNDLSGNSLYSVYPNPAKDLITLTTQKYNAATFVVTDLTGREVLRQEIISTKQNINTSSISNGVYMYSIFDANNLFEKGKLLIKGH